MLLLPNFGVAAAPVPVGAGRLLLVLGQRAGCRRPGRARARAGAAAAARVQPTCGTAFGRSVRTEQGIGGPGKAERVQRRRRELAPAAVTVQPRASSSGAGTGTSSGRQTSGRMQWRGGTTRGAKDAAAGEREQPCSSAEGAVHRVNGCRVAPA